MTRKKISNNQAKILAQLSKLNREITRKELNEYLGLSSATLHYSIIGLELLGLVGIKQAKGSGNSHIITLTEKGKSCL